MAKDLKRRIVAEFSAKNKAKGAMTGFRRDMDRTGQAMRRMASGALALAGIGGFGLLAKSMISAASSAEETQAKFNTVFKELSGQANIWAESFGKSVGRSERSVKSWMAGLQDTFVPLGIARGEALKLAQSLTTLAVDVASFNDAADADVIRDFTSALVGNHETVRKFGIIISESALKQEAMRQGINKTYKNLTDLEKVQLRYNLILAGTSDAQGDAMRTADSYANQVKRLYANLDDLKVSMGEELLPVFTDLVKQINENEKALVAFSKAILAPVKSLLYLIDIIDALHEVQKGHEPGPMPGWGLHGFEMILPPLPEGKLEISPWAMQQIAKMRAAIRQREQLPDFMTTFPEVKKFEREPFSWEKVPQEITEDHRKAANEIEQVWTEMWLKQEEAAYHAMRAPILEAEEAMRAQVLAADEALQEIEQRADEFAMTFRDVIASGFERSMRDAKNWEEHMINMLENVYWAAVRMAFLDPMAGALAKGLTGVIGAVLGPGIFATPAPTTPTVFTSPHGGPALQHGGEVLETGWAKVHKGETYSGVKEGGGFEFHIHNEGQEKLEISRVESYLISEQRVIDITTRAMQTDVKYRRSIAQASR